MMEMGVIRRVLRISISHGTAPMSVSIASWPCVLACVLACLRACVRACLVANFLCASRAQMRERELRDPARCVCFPVDV